VADTKADVTGSSGLFCSTTGFPRPQLVLVAAAGVTAASVAVSGLGRRRPDIMLLLPPRMFRMVAVCT